MFEVGWTWYLLVWENVQELCLTEGSRCFESLKKAHWNERVNVLFHPDFGYLNVQRCSVSCFEEVDFHDLYIFFWGVARTSDGDVRMRKKRMTTKNQIGQIHKYVGNLEWDFDIS